MRAKQPCVVAGCPLTAVRMSRCEQHAREAEARRGGSTARGYDAKHERTRRRLLSRAYGQPCPLCGVIMKRTDDLDLDHTTRLKDDPTSRGDRIVHRRCNQQRPKG